LLDQSLSNAFWQLGSKVAHRIINDLHQGNTLFITPLLGDDLDAERHSLGADF